MQKQQRRTRAPRVSVPNNEQALVSIEGEQLRGTLCLVSLTGGTIRLAKEMASGAFADIGIKTVTGNVSAAIQFLDKTGGNTQAFRFVSMGTTARKRLHEALKAMQERGLGIEKDNAFGRLLKQAGRIITLGVLQ